MKIYFQELFTYAYFNANLLLLYDFNVKNPILVHESFGTWNLEDGSGAVHRAAVARASFKPHLMPIKDK